MFSLPPSPTHLNCVDDVDLVEEDERVESGHHVLLEKGGGRQNDLLDVHHLVRLVDLVQQSRVVERHHLPVRGHLCQVVPVTRGDLLAGIVLKAADNGHDVLVQEHDVEEGDVVDEEEGAEDVVEIVKPVGVLQVLADAEELEQLRDIRLPLHGERKVLAVWQRGDCCSHQVQDLLQLAQLAQRELDEDRTLLKNVRSLSRALLGGAHQRTPTLNLW